MRLKLGCDGYVDFHEFIATVEVAAKPRGDSSMHK